MIALFIDRSRRSDDDPINAPPVGASTTALGVIGTMIRPIWIAASVVMPIALMWGGYAVLSATGTIDSIRQSSLETNAKMQVPMGKTAVLDSSQFDGSMPWDGTMEVTVEEAALHPTLMMAGVPEDAPYASRLSSSELDDGSQYLKILIRFKNESAASPKPGEAAGECRFRYTPDVLDGDGLVYFSGASPDAGAATADIFLLAKGQEETYSAVYRIGKEQAEQMLAHKHAELQFTPILIFDLDVARE